MNKNEISIATITWARDESEEKLLSASLECLAQLEVPVFITDEGSTPHFLDFLRSFPHFHLLPSTGNNVWSQVKNSLAATHQAPAPFVFYSEPDKKDFFSQHLPRMIDALNINESTGIVTASRSAVGFATFPTFQQMTETTINNCVAEVVGPKMDYTYGPFLLNKNLIPYLLQMKEDTSWGWRPYAFAIAKKLGYKVESFEGDFYCPSDQRNDTPADRLYRMKQLSQNIQGLLLAANVEC